MRRSHDLLASYALIGVALGRGRCDGGSIGWRGGMGDLGWPKVARSEGREREEREKNLIFLVFEFSKPEFIVFSIFS